MTDHQEALDPGFEPAAAETSTHSTLSTDSARPAKSDSAPLVQEVRLPPGASQVRLIVHAADAASVDVDVEARTTDGFLLGRQSIALGETATPLSPLYWGLSRVGTWLEAHSGAVAIFLFWLGLGIYAFTRFYALPEFPIYFFTDEAIQTVSAVDLLNNNFRSSANDEVLPTYFQNGTQYNLSASVYLQVLPYLLLDKSIWVTRGVAALMTLMAAGAVGLMHRRVFKGSYPWLAVLLLSITPAWFLHSRTAFETVLACSFYAAFLYFYLLYRTENPQYIYAAVVTGALAGYSYSGMRMVVLVTCLLLAVSDLKYHWQKRIALLPAIGLAGVLLLPLVRFLINHPDASRWQMRLLGSYWILDIPLIDKIGSFAIEYLRGLNPLYWYMPNRTDLPRHLMLGYGHLLRQTFPLGFLGIVLALWRFRNPAYRVLLIAVLAAPTGAALVRLGITRALVMVIPIAILTALGTETVIEWLQARRKSLRGFLPLAVFVILAGANLYMLRDALVNGPLWFRDYGLTGLQYGARQVFPEIEDYLNDHPGTRIILSPSWANGTDVVARFFFDDPLPFELGSVVGFFDEVKPLDDNTLFIMIPEEFVKIPASRFTDIRLEKALAYPDGRPGFFFVRLKYVPNIAEVIAKEETTRRLPRQERFTIAGRAVDLQYTPLDMGEIGDLFDGSRDSLVRSWAINPLLLAFDFSEPRSLETVTVHVGGTATTFRVKVWAPNQETPTEITRSAPETPLPRDVQLDLPARMNVTRLEISIQNTNDPPNGHVHVWEVILK